MSNICCPKTNLHYQEPEKDRCFRAWKKRMVRLFRYFWR